MSIEKDQFDRFTVLAALCAKKLEQTTAALQQAVSGLDKIRIYSEEPFAVRSALTALNNIAEELKKE